MNVLFVLAHNDDEYFASLRIGEELRLGNRVLVAYLTHGSIHGADSKLRMQESLRVLNKLGILPADVLMIGYEQDIFDQKLHERIVDAYRKLGAFLEHVAIGRVYVLAWEGGHPDHDASHMIGVAFARRHGLQQQLYEFPAYNRFHVMQYAYEGAGALTTAPNRLNALRTLGSAFGYRSQRKTFLALLPGSLLQLLLRGRQSYRPVPADRDYAKPPHGGRLFYEKKFRISFERFIQDARALDEVTQGRLSLRT